MNNPKFVHFYSNDLFLYTKQLDTRIPLNELRTYLSFGNSVQFLHETAPVETYSEKELKISDVLHSKTEVYLREMNTNDTTGCISEAGDDISVKVQLLNKNRRKKSKKENIRRSSDVMDHLISPTLLSNWYRNTVFRIKQVNFEIDRKRFTSLLFNPDKTTKKISLNISTLLGKLTLSYFIKECMPLIESFFNRSFNISTTKYLNIIDDRFVIDR
jgi:hypothetical protein